MNSKKQKPLGPVVHWDTQPAAEPAGMSRNQRQVQRPLLVAERMSDAFQTHVPSSYSEEVIGDGCYHTRRKPGAE